MSTDDPSEERPEPFVVAGPPDVLRPLLELLEADPRATVTAVARDARSDPERLCVALAPGRAAALQSALGGLVLVEPDLPLQPGGPSS